MTTLSPESLAGKIKNALKLSKGVKIKSIIFQLIIMEIRKISAKGQIVIPKEIRELAGLKAGDAVLFKVSDKVIVIEKIEKQSESMAELLKKGNPFQKNLVNTLRTEWD